jgi:hypothetical protein
MLTISTAESVLHYVRKDIENKILILDSEIDSISCFCFGRNQLIQQRLELIHMLSKLDHISNLLNN